MRPALALALLVLPAACSGGEPWTYATPEVVGPEALLERLRPTRAGELVLANFWASW